MDERKVAIGMLGVVMVFLGLAGEGDYEDAVAQDKVYCDMVALHLQTGGEAGHPNYEGRNCGE